MAIKNPYSLAEHRTFRRTFLQQTEVIVTFTPALSDVDFRNGIIPYLKSVFDLDLSDKADPEANHAEIKSDDEQKQFIFDLDKVRFLIGPKSYKTFAETALPMVGMLIRFICDVAKRDLIDSLNIIKINGWPIKADNAYGDFTDMIRYTFKENCVSDMLSYKFDADPQPVRLSKTFNSEIEDDVRLDAMLSAEVMSKEKVNLGLVLNASVKNISVNDVLSDSIALNDIIYQRFVETISENIINLMSRENLS